jgi:formate dehydrogenase iron-sulfur subunit
MLALLYDAGRCVACGSCLAACREMNRLPETDAAELNDNQFTAIRTVFGRGGKVHYRRMCMHCLEPTCVSVCPVGALKKLADGPVVYNASLCLGCRYCVQACPFVVPKYEWHSLNPRIRKCDFCAGLLAEGKRNACAEACPTGATVAGPRPVLLEEAGQRMAAEPDKYVRHIYGEHEVGGTSVLMLSPVPFERLGMPVHLPAAALPTLTFGVLSKVPAITATLGYLLAGLWWLTRRRASVAGSEGTGRADNA